MVNKLPLQSKQLQLQGLFTDPNRFSAVPDASLLTAENINFNKEGVIEVRRGNGIYGAVDVGASKVKKLFQYDDTLLVHHDDKISYDSDNAGNFIEYSGTYVEPTGGYLQGVEASQNIYINTSTGIKVIDAVNGTPRAAGVTKALGGSAVVGSTDSGFLPTGEERQYRIVWAYVDANKNLKLGDVSERIVVTNSSGDPQYVNLTFYIPDDITTANTFRIYRTKQTTDLTNLFLVGERAPTSGEIVAQAVTFLDNVEDTQLGEQLYTSFEDGGLTQGNAQPPIANDMAFFKNHVLYANTTGQHTFTLQLTKIADGLALNDTVTIGGRVYTAKSSETPASNYLKLLTGGVESEDIEATARSLIKIINLDTGNTALYADYLSTVQDPTGKILLRERNIGGAGFAITSSVADCWFPELPASGTSVTSDNSRLVNGLFFSKQQQPEAVPITNLFRVGSANYGIRRLAALRDNVFIFKDDGLHQMYGVDRATFEVKEFDLTVKLLVDASVASLADQVYAFTTQGIVVADGQGVTPISYAIEADLLQLQTYPNFETATFAVAYESERKYILYTVATPTDEHASQAFVYNAKTKQWTKWLCGDISAGHVLSRDDKLYLASADAVEEVANILQERKGYNRLDFADESYSITITAVSEDEMTITVADADHIDVGDTIKQEGKTAEVVAIDGLDITVNEAKDWVADDEESPETEVYKPIEAMVEFMQFDFGEPGVQKTFDEVFLFFRETKVDALSVYFATSLHRTQEYQIETITPTSYDGTWGEFQWGTGEWGGGPGGGQQVIRVVIPRMAREGNWLKLKIGYKQAFTSFQLEGLTVQYYTVSERIK